VLPFLLCIRFEKNQIVIFFLCIFYFCEKLHVVFGLRSISSNLLAENTNELGLFFYIWFYTLAEQRRGPQRVPLLQNPGTCVANVLNIATTVNIRLNEISYWRSLCFFINYVSLRCMMVVLGLTSRLWNAPKILTRCRKGWLRDYKKRISNFDGGFVRSQSLGGVPPIGFDVVHDF